MRACWLKWVGWDWSISADYIWLIFSDANNKTMRALKDTNGFYFYIDDCTSDEYESTWQEMPEDWRSGSDPDYTEDFRSIAKKELKGENLKIVLASLAEQAQ